MGEGIVNGDLVDDDDRCRRAWAGRRIEERRRGDSVDLEARDIVHKERVWWMRVGRVSVFRMKINPERSTRWLC